MGQIQLQNFRSLLTPISNYFNPLFPLMSLPATLFFFTFFNTLSFDYHHKHISINYTEVKPVLPAEDLTIDSSYRCSQLENQS